ncbi:MAG: hypothetical protein EOM24_22940 [Chloroflexia bacterium]|nr:hypothetical protein [Chloroflexia bacterium]
MKPTPQRHARFVFARLTIEALTGHYLALVDAEDRQFFVTLLSRCFGCEAVLTAAERQGADGLCTQCRQRRAWQRN